MKVIKDKDLLGKVLNVIYNIDFGLYHRNLKIEKTKENIEEHEELLKEYSAIDTEIESHKYFITQIENFIDGQKGVVEEATKLDEMELPFIEKLQSKYERLNDGYYKFDVEWFKENIELLIFSKLTTKIEEDTILLMKELKYPLYEEVLENVKKQ